VEYHSHEQNDKEQWTGTSAERIESQGENAKRYRQQAVAIDSSS
jgi:hypothetical protein